MGSAPSLDVPTWEGKTPTNQAPLQSSNPPINYTGSYGQPGNNFQGMGKSPQMGGPQQMGGMPGMGVPQMGGVPSNPVAQGSPMQPPQMPQQQQMPQQSIYSMMGGGSNGMPGYDGAVSPEYMAMVGRPGMQDAYRQRMASRPNVFF